MHDPFRKRLLYPCIFICPRDNKHFLLLGTYITSCKTRSLVQFTIKCTMPIPSIDQAWLFPRYAFPWLHAGKVVNHTLIGLTWNDAPKSTVHICDKTSSRTRKISIRSLSIIYISCAWIKIETPLTSTWYVDIVAQRIYYASYGSSMMTWWH